MHPEDAPSDLVQQQEDSSTPSDSYGSGELSTPPASLPLFEQDSFSQNNATEEPSRYVAKKGANKYLKYTGDARDVEIVCYECYEKHWIIKNASSSMCPKCGTYISLKDHEINTRWNSSIKTRGNVTVYKKGVVKNVSLFCNNLTVEGEFDATCQCTGDFTLRRDTALTGRISCRRLVLERKVKVSSQLPLQLESALVDGTLVSDVVCTGTLKLTKHSKIIGSLKTKALEMEPGAKHEGAIQMG